MPRGAIRSPQQLFFSGLNKDLGLSHRRNIRLVRGGGKRAVSRAVRRRLSNIISRERQLPALFSFYIYISQVVESYSLDPGRLSHYQSLTRSPADGIRGGCDLVRGRHSLSAPLFVLLNCAAAGGLVPVPLHTKGGRERARRG